MYLPSLPLYARMPESTLTPAPVNNAIFPTSRNRVTDIVDREYRLRIEDGSWDAWYRHPHVTVGE